MPEIRKGWATGRPIYDRMPVLMEPYVDPINQYLLDIWDESMMSSAEQMLVLDTFFNPQTCPDEWLDYIAPAYGFEQPYYNAAFTNSVKRKLLVNALTEIWPYIGTMRGLRTVFNCLELDVILRIPGDFILSGPYEQPVIMGSVLGDQLGSKGWEYQVIMPSRYDNTDLERLVRLQIELYGPCWVRPVFAFRDAEFASDYLFVEPDVLFDIGNEIALRI